MTTRTVKEINFNTVLLTVTLAISGWTLKKVIELGESTAVLKSQVGHLEGVVYKNQNDQ